MQYFVRIRQNVGYLDGEDGAGVEDGVGSLARADLEADGGGEEVGRLLEHLRELPPVGGKEVPVGNSVPWRGAREREQEGLAMAIDGFGLLKLLGRGSHFVIERLQTSVRLKWSRLSVLRCVWFGF